MPSYATVWKDPSGQLTVFQIANKLGRGKFYYRVQIPGQKRVEGLIANEFTYSDLHYSDLNQEYEFEAVKRLGGPPEHIIERANRVLHRFREKSGRGEELKTVKTPTVRRAAQEFRERMENDFKNGLVSKSKWDHMRSFLDRYVIPYEPWFDKIIDKVKSGDMLAWQRWRDTYWFDGPGKTITHLEYKRGGKTLKREIQPSERVVPRISTKNSEWVFFKRVFLYAVEKGWMSEDDIPKHKFRKTDSPDSEVTPAFTAEEWEHIEAMAPGWIDPAKLMGDNRYYRQLCWWFMVLCRAYALRVAECYLLTVGNIAVGIDRDTHEPIVSVDLAGVKSVKHGRKAEPIHRFSDQVRKILTEEIPAFYAKHLGRELTPNDPLWMNKDGTRLGTVEGSFNSFLSDISLTHDSKGAKFTLTSLRHSAITEEIETTDLNPAIIAVWAGTSVKMINDHYNHALANRARRLERKRREAQGLVQKEARTKA